MYRFFRDNWRRCGPANLFGSVKGDASWIDMADRIKNFYIENEEMDIDKHFKNITDMFTDAMFTYGTDYTVR